MTPAPMRILAVAAASAIALLALRSASFISTASDRGASAWVRLSWSARPERIEHCRRLTDAELEARPAHMRLRLECEGRFARYMLQLTVDDTVTVTDTVQGGGLRHDRPMHVLREHPLDPGTRRLLITLVRLDSLGAEVSESTTEADAHSERDAQTASAAPGVSPDAESDTVLGEREGREREERVRRAGEAIPARLSLDTTITLGAGRVVLITYDGARRTLVANAGRTNP